MIEYRMVRSAENVPAVQPVLLPEYSPEYSPEYLPDYLRTKK